MRQFLFSLILAASGTLLLVSCEVGSDILAPYAGHRPLILQRVTTSYFPDVQWVGGRVAAVGVNRGAEPALDETLVWLRTSSDDDISSPVRLSQGGGREAAAEFGGVPQDSLADEVEYTFWLAETAAFEALRSGATPDPTAFVDTTITLKYSMFGRSSGDRALNVEFEVIRDQRLDSDEYRVYWTPATVEFRTLAINRGTLGSFANMAWHVVVPEDSDETIRSPVVIGQAPPGTVVAQEWLGFEPANHVLWAATADWAGTSFGLRTTGYASFQLFANNFQ